MHKLTNRKYMASRKNAKDDWCERQSTKRSRLFLMFISAFVDPPKRGVDFNGIPFTYYRRKNNCQKI